jgi:hypothetical protein
VENFQQFSRLRKDELRKIRLCCRASYQNYQPESLNAIDHLHETILLAIDKVEWEISFSFDLFLFLFLSGSQRASDDDSH